MGGYENIAIMDTDELFVPTKHISITVMLEELESLYPGFHSVNFESFLYLPLQSISKEQPKWVVILSAKIMLHHLDFTKWSSR